MPKIQLATISRSYTVDITTTNSERKFYIYLSHINAREEEKERKKSNIDRSISPFEWHVRSTYILFSYTHLCTLKHRFILNFDDNMPTTAKLHRSGSFSRLQK